MNETAQKPERVVSKQLDDKSRKQLWVNLNKRIESAHSEIKKMAYHTEDMAAPGYDKDKAGKPKLHEELTPQEVKDIKYLNKRIDELQLSLRLAFNTNWIVEQRQELIADTSKILREEFSPGWEMAPDLTDEIKKEKETAYSKHIARLNSLTKAMKCKRKGCYTGRGWTGLNASTGEFVMCQCTDDTVQYYKLHD